MSTPHDSNRWRRVRRSRAGRVALIAAVAVSGSGLVAVTTSAQAASEPAAAAQTLAAPVDGSSAGLEGFATLSGYGRTGTNGGVGGTTINVSNYEQLAAAVAGNESAIVRVSGTITGNGDAMLDVGSNKTIVGVGSNATISGFGLNVDGFGPEAEATAGDSCDAGEQGAFTPVGNVIIQNLSFRNSADDSIQVQCHSHHVWIHHNSFYPAADGSVDIKRGSDLATVSHNRFIGTDKSMLLGHSDDNGAQDTGLLHVTYHHNWFDGSNTRHPRVRFGYAHLYANYVNVTDYFIGLGVEGKIYAEANYVAAAKTITQDFGNAALVWTSSNFYDTATITRANDSGKTQADWLRVGGSVSAPPYSVSTGSAPSSPPAAGAGTSGAESL